MVSDYDDAGQVKWLADARIDLIRGNGRIADQGVVEVDGRRYGARHIVIATGSEPVIPPIPGLADLDGVWTNREATAVQAVLESIVILGGGPVGVEMAQAFSTLGAAVDLVEGMDHILPREPRALGDALADALGGERLRIHLGRRAARRPVATTSASLSPSRMAARSTASGCSSPRVVGLGSVILGLRTSESNPLRADSRLMPG